MHEYFQHILTDHANWAYLVLVIGTFLEGETILILAGIAAAIPGSRLDVWLCILSAFAGSMSGDQLYFFIGRYKGPWLLAKLPKWRPRIDRVLGLLERHKYWLLLTFRFFYGLRNVTTFGAGMSRVPTRLFVLLNAVGAIIWAITFGMGGYLFGEAAKRTISHFHHYQFRFFVAVAVLLAEWWIIRVLRRRRAERRKPND